MMTQETLCAALITAATLQAAPQPYRRPDQLQPLPAAAASLYRTPWRARLRTAAADQALQGIGVYYKHTPEAWTLADHTRVMQQLAAAGVRRLRLAPHHALYMHPDWRSPSDGEWQRLNVELRACYSAGLRPCVVFVHIPPYGKPGELQTWFTRNWNKGLLPADEVGTATYDTFLAMTYRALSCVLDAARAAGFVEPDSWDLELGQGIWWGAPAIPEPPPSTALDDLQPGGRIHTFEAQLIERTRSDGYDEPRIWWGMTHHLFAQYDDGQLPASCAGRTISFYAQGCAAADTYLTATQHDKPWGALDEWPARPPLHWAEEPTPGQLLARPEGWMADRSRHDNLIELLAGTARPVAITSLGTVPETIPGWTPAAASGWLLKQKGVTRSLAFWLNQGAAFVLLHSAYEGKQDEGSHALIPHLPDPQQCRFEAAPPLATLARFRQALADCEPVSSPRDFELTVELDPDPLLTPGPAAVNGGLRASDLLVVLPFQLSAGRFAFALYVMTPNIAVPLADLTLTLRLDAALQGAPTATDPVSGQDVAVEVIARQAETTTVRLAIADAVRWLQFEVAPAAP